jgi:amicyanin
MAKSTWIFLGVVAILVVIGLVYFMSNPSNKSLSDTNSQVNTTPPLSNSGGNPTPDNTNPASQTPKTYTIDIANFAFSPKTLTIHTGDTITWTNKDSAPHTVTSDSGSELDSPTLNTNQIYTHTFSTAGTYDYHCTVHPMMKATIIVE